MYLQGEPMLLEIPLKTLGFRFRTVKQRLGLNGAVTCTHIAIVCGTDAAIGQVLKGRGGCSQPDPDVSIESCSKIIESGQENVRRTWLILTEIIAIRKSPTAEGERWRSSKVLSRLNSVVSRERSVASA
jgi:hypothetical protein